MVATGDVRPDVSDPGASSGSRTGQALEEGKHSKQFLVFGIGEPRRNRDSVRQLVAESLQGFVGEFSGGLTRSG